MLIFNILDLFHNFNLQNYGKCYNNLPKTNENIYLRAWVVN